MPLSSRFDYSHLAKKFSIAIPDNLRLTDSIYPDAIEETGKFAGLSWDRVDSGLLRNEYDVLFFFSPEAMHYYFPAYMRCANEELATTRAMKVMDLPLNTLLGQMFMSNNDVFNKWRRDRWRIFSQAQRDLILDWLDWLFSEFTNHSLEALDNLVSARQAFKDGVWWDKC